MHKHVMRVALLAVLASGALAAPSQAQMGAVKVAIVKVGGAGGVQLKNDKGVMISLRGIRAGLELSAI